MRQTELEKFEIEIKAHEKSCKISGRSQQKLKNIASSAIEFAFENILSNWKGKIPNGIPDQIFNLLLNLSDARTKKEAKVIYKYFKNEMSSSSLANVLSMDPWNFCITPSDHELGGQIDFKISLARNIVIIAQNRPVLKHQTEHCELCHRQKKTNRYCHLHANKNKRRNREKIMTRHTLKLAEKTKNEVNQHNKWAAKNRQPKIPRTHKSIAEQRLEVWVLAKFERMKFSPSGRFAYKKETDNVRAVSIYCKQFLPNSFKMIEPLIDNNLNEFAINLSEVMDVPVSCLLIANVDPVELLINQLTRYQLAIDIFGHEKKEAFVRKNEIQKAFRNSKNKTALAKKLGISRARLYQIVHEAS